MVHVLDHLIDPLAMLTQIRTKLRPGGTLIIVTHNECSLLSKIMGRRWPPFCLQQPALFNSATIARLLTRARFGRIAVAPNRNYFPIEFIVRQAAWTIGMTPPRRLALPRRAIGPRLGNIITLAAAPRASSPADRVQRLETVA